MTTPLMVELTPDRSHNKLCGKTEHFEEDAMSSKPDLLDRIVYWYCMIVFGSCIGGFFALLGYWVWWSVHHPHG